MNTAVATVALLLSFGLLAARQGTVPIAICAAQAVCAAIVLHSLPSLLVLALNGAALPLAMRRLGVVAAPRCLSWPLVIVLLVLVVLVLAAASDIVALGTGVTLLGLLVALRVSPLLGLVSAQNGLVLVACAVPDLPMATLLVVALPVVPAISLAHAWQRS